MSAINNNIGNIGKQPILRPDEIFLINLLREKNFQEIVVKVQDGEIISASRTERWTKKKGNLTNYFTP